MPSIFKSKEDDEKPKGFEKFFKKKEPSSQKDDDKDKKGDEEKKAKKDDDDDDLSEEETEEKEDKQSKTDERNKLTQFLFEPDNNPRPEGWLAVFTALATGWYLFNYKKPMKEIVYMEFLNEYLLKNQIKEINITKDKRSEVFNFRAEIHTHDGERMYMTLNSYESFLAKLDLVQREMGKQPHEFIPVKYTNQSEEPLSASLMNVAVGAMFLAFFYQVYKGRNGNKPSTGKKTGKGASSDKDKKGGGFFGGGGMNDMFGMSKSNAKQFGGEDGQKIKTRFKHVAGNEGAKNEIMEFVDFLKNPKKY